MSAPTAAPPFSPRTLIALILVGVFAFSGFTVLSVYAPDLKGGEDGEAHALSKSAIGFGGAVALLKLRGVPVVISRSPLTHGRSGGELRVITPPVNPDPKQISAYRGDGPLLIILPKWVVAPDTLRTGWVRKVAAGAPEAAAQPIRAQKRKIDIRQRRGAAQPRLNRVDGPLAPGLSLPLDRIESFQTLAGEGWRPVLVDDQGGVVLASWGDSQTYVLSDPDLLNTQGLKGLNNTRAGMAILDALRGGEGVAFDVTLNGFIRSRNALKLMFEPPLVGGFLCLLAAAVLTGISAAMRFGPVVREPRAFALGKRALIDNSADLVRAAHKEHELAGAYATLTAARAARALGERETDAERRAARLARIEQRRKPHEALGDLTTAAQAARTRDETRDVAARLFQWRSEITHERH